MTDRATLSRTFLNQAGWGDATRAFLAGDASDRRYERVTRPGGSAVLMDAPPGQGDDPAAFLTIARHLRGLGLSAPEVLAFDPGTGFMLLEDLGDALFARRIAADASLDLPLTVAAAAVLAEIQRHPAPADLANLAAADWAEAAAFALDWYAFAATGERPADDGFRAALTEALATHADGPRVLILRDYHAENLIWLQDRQGLAQVGLLDFQLAQMGQPGYDLVSLVQDARRDLPAKVAQAAVQRFLDLSGRDETAFSTSLAVLGAQRALRILGIFARLCLVSGKPGYLPLIPRVWGQLQTNLAHPSLAPLARICDRLLPPPAPEVLNRIRTRCATPPSP